VGTRSRIQELAEQAGIAIWSDAVYMYHPNDTLDYAVLEKFVKLIVRECALTAGLMEHEGRQGIGAQILDNFGVEE
jgi:hypothetical protein